MPRPLPRLLSPRDLPEAELRAAVLDGELYALGDRWSSVADPDDAEARARSVLSESSSRTIAARRTAAWIWGACAAPPPDLQCLVSSSARSRGAPSGSRVSEVRIDDDEVVRLGGVLVTSPARTVLDLLRLSDPHGEAEELALRVLGDHGVEPRSVLALSRRHSSAVGRARAQALLCALVDPVLG